MGRRHGGSSIRRRPPSRDPKHRILVVCEGKKTEPRYLTEFQTAMRNRLVDVKVDKKSGAPEGLVDRAIKLAQQANEFAQRERDDYLRFDEVWCVFDVDEHPVAKACATASANNIQVAISNPCFELWALLHFRDQTAELHRREAQREVKKLLPGYEKELPFDRLHGGYEQAVRRAQALDESAARDGARGRNPTTTIYVLTERIKKHGQT